jgi:hypothetical protein
MPNTHLVDRIRNEYREMPGMRLTLPQARRLWHVDVNECEAALDALVDEGFLALTLDDSYVACPVTSRVRLKPAKAALQPQRVRIGRGA